MAPITEEQLKSKKDDLLKQRDQIMTTVHALSGAIQLIDHLLSTAEDKEEEQFNGS